LPEITLGLADDDPAGEDALEPFCTTCGNWHDAGLAQSRRHASVQVIVIHRQEVRPMSAASAVGAPPQSTIARLR
jgi:hypothetical protein